MKEGLKKTDAKAETLKSFRITVPFELWEWTEKFPNKSELCVQALYQCFQLLSTCQQCKKPIGKEHDYMLGNEIWEQYGVGIGRLCIDCLEKRLGRKLQKSDLADVPANQNNPYTQKLF